MDTSKSEHWSETWQSNKLTSLGDLMPNNYDGTFLKFWKDVITDDASKIVDLACGNGALSWIMHDIITSRDMSARVIGVDFAEIDPFSILERDKSDYPFLEFIGNTPIEKLPFEDNSVDCFISQYGIEYSDLSKTIPELARALNDKGKMAFIMHEINSEVLQGALQSLLPCKLAHKKFKLHEKFLKLSKLYDSEKKRNRLQDSELIRKQTMKIEQTIQTIGSQCQDRNEIQSFYVYLDEVNKAFNQSSLTKSQRDKIITASRDRNVDYMKRILDLEAAAINEKRREELRSLVEAEGFEVTLDEMFHYDNHGVFGLAFIAERK